MGTRRQQLARTPISADRRNGRARWLMVLVAVASSAYGIPYDMEGTTRAVHKQGVVDGDVIAGAARWAALRAGKASGIKVELIRRFALERRVKIRWAAGSRD